MIIEAPGEQVKPASKCPDCDISDGIRLCPKHSIAAKREIALMAGWSVTRKSA